MSSLQELTEQLLKQHTINFKHLKSSNQGQIHQGFFIDDTYYIKRYSTEEDYANALLQESCGPQIINKGIYYSNPRILFEQIKGKTIAELLPSVHDTVKTTILRSYLLILKSIHSHTKDGLIKVHGDYHIGNILLTNNHYDDLSSYTVIDRDRSHYSNSLQDEYGAIIETIAIPAAIVSELLEYRYEDKDLYEIIEIAGTIYPTLIGNNPQGFMNECDIRAEKKFNSENGNNARANAMGNKILQLKEFIRKLYF